MSLRVLTGQLSPGLRLRQPASHGAQLLLPAGKVLNAADVDFLRKRLGTATTLFVEDPLVDRLSSLTGHSAEDEYVAVARRALLEQLCSIQERVQHHLVLGRIDPRALESTLRGLCSFLAAYPVLAAHLADPKKNQHYIALHSAEVFYLSLYLGLAVRDRILEAYRHTAKGRESFRRVDIDLTGLALSALFMDLGMWPLKDLYDQSETLTDEQCRQVRHHPHAGTLVLPLSAPELVKLVIETHHENYDGSGYPYGLHGDQIHLFARILRLADAFAAATTTQGHRRPLSLHRALWDMTRGPFSPCYDPVMLKAFGALVHPFPIGAKVKLSTGCTAVVVGFGEIDPFLPTIVLAYDENDRLLPARRGEGPLSLHDHKHLRIVAVGEEDVSDFTASEAPAQPATPCEFRTLFDSMYTGRASVPSLESVSV